MSVCKSDVLYHYLLENNSNATSIIDNGLLPLSAFPESTAWKNLETALPNFYQQLYELLAEPIIKLPYKNSGVFLTPIDFRKIPDSHLSNHTRIAIPREIIDPDCAVLTYVFDEERISLPLTEDNLKQTASLWPAVRIKQWFAKNPNMIFFYVPQVAVYQDGAIPIKVDWIER